MKTSQSVIQRSGGSLLVLARKKKKFSSKKYLLPAMILTFMLFFVPGCKKADNKSSDNTSSFTSNLDTYNNTVVNLNNALEDFILKSQTFEGTNFTGKTHDESKKIVDDYIASGETLKSELDQILAQQGGTGSLFKSSKESKDGPCKPEDLLPGGTGGVSPSLVKSVGDLISSTKGDVDKIEAQHNNGQIDDDTYNAALNTLKTQKLAKTFNLGFGAVSGTGAAVFVGIAAGTAGAPALVVIGAATATGLVVGVACTWICSWYTGSKLKNGQDSTTLNFMTTGKSKLGDPIPSTMMQNGATLTICVDGYTPVCVKDLALPDKGKTMTIQINPVKIEDATQGMTTQVCFLDSVITAGTCDQVVFVTAVPNPPDPAPGQSVTVNATIIPAVTGCNVSFTIVGTDGYTNSGTYPTDSEGNASFYIPGGAAGVIDVVTITSSNGKTYTVSYVF